MKFTKTITEHKNVELRVLPAMTPGARVGMTDNRFELGTAATPEDLRALGYVPRDVVLRLIENAANNLAAAGHAAREPLSTLQHLVEGL